MTYKELVYKLADRLTKANLMGVVIASFWVLSNSGFVSASPVIAVLILYRFLLPVLVFPSTIFSNFMIFFNYKEKFKLEKLMLTLSMSWLNAAISIWVAVIFYFAVNRFSRGYVEAGALWGATVAMSSLLMWVQIDKENPFLVSVIEALQIAVIALAVYRINVEEISFWGMFLCLFSIMSCFSLLGVFFEKRLKSK